MTWSAAHIVVGVLFASIHWRQRKVSGDLYRSGLMTGLWLMVAVLHAVSIVERYSS